MLTETNTDLYWIAGLLEGEGSFLKTPPSSKSCISIQLEMTDKDVVEKAAKILGVPICSPKQRNPKHKITYKLRITHGRAAEWMKQLKPFMGQRRQKQIEEALKTYNPVIHSFKIPPLKDLLEMKKTMSLRQIAKKVGCSHQSILRHLKT